MGWLRGREPRLIWDRSKLRTREDWLQAGEVVFDFRVAYGAIAAGTGHNEQLYKQPVLVRGGRPSWLKRRGLPRMRYVVQQKGKVEIGILACAMCRTGVLSDGSILKGGPGNYPFDAAFAENIETEDAAIANNRRLVESLYATPWSSEFSSRLQSLDERGLSTLLSNRPAGVMTGIGAPLTLCWRFRTQSEWSTGSILTTQDAVMTFSPSLSQHIRRRLWTPGAVQDITRCLHCSDCGIAPRSGTQAG